MSSRPEEGLELAQDAKGAHWAIPMPGKRLEETLRTLSAVPALGVYELTAPIAVAKSRQLHVYVAVDAKEIGNQVSIIPEFSMDPAGSDTSFFTEGVSSTSFVLGNLGTAPGGEYTLHNFGAVTYRPRELPTPAAITAADMLRMSVTLDVEKACWVRFRIAEDNFSYASGVLTLAANVSDTNTVTIDGKVYTFEAVLTDVDGNVQLGASDADSIANLVAAIGLGAGAGVAYAASTTTHPTVQVSASSATTMTVTAIDAGVGGNAIATTETSGTASWGAGTLVGGTGVLLVSHLGLSFSRST